jgi:hypothetical protein
MAYRHIPSGRIQPTGKLRSFVKRAAEQAMSSSTGRYYPGQELYGIAFSYESKDMSSYRAPMLHDTEYPSAIHILKLVVTHHHRVPNEYDDKPNPTLDNDGYLLMDTRDRVFTNQYPRASYGQLSDTGNRVFTEDVKIDFDERFKTEKNDPVEYILITDVYSDICKGIRDITRKLNEDFNPRRSYQGLDFSKLWEKRKSLDSLRIEIEEKFTELTKGKALYAKPRFRGAFLHGAIADTKQEALAAMYVPVMSRHALVALVKKIKSRRVDSRKRILPGNYIRIYSNMDNGRLNFEHVLLGGYQSRAEYGRSRHGKANHTPSVPGRYRMIYAKPNSTVKALKDGYGCFASDMAGSGVLLRVNADVQMLQKEFGKLHVTGFELGVLFKGWPDTQERFVEYMEDLEHNRYMDDMLQETLNADLVNDR